jgi:hypothetical protein
MSRAVSGKSVSWPKFETGTLWIRCRTRTSHLMLSFDVVAQNLLWSNRLNICKRVWKLVAVSNYHLLHIYETCTSVTPCTVLSLNVLLRPIRVVQRKNNRPQKLLSWLRFVLSPPPVSVLIAPRIMPHALPSTSFPINCLLIFVLLLASHLL